MVAPHISQTIGKKLGTNRMRYVALATDGDGTLLVDGQMPPATAAALARARAAKIVLLLVTGESRKELAEFPRLDLFDRVVAENGAMLLDPATDRETVLGESPPAELVQALCAANLERLKIGRVIITAKMSDESVLRREVDRLGINWHVLRNRHDAMILPAGFDKASGLDAALTELGIPKSQVIAIGDAENDVAMVRCCGLGVAVADAVPVLRDQADMVTHSGAGQAIVEVVDRLLSGGLPTPRCCEPFSDSNAHQ